MTWTVLSWSGGHEFESLSGRTWGAWYFYPKSYLNQKYTNEQLMYVTCIPCKHCTWHKHLKWKKKEFWKYLKLAIFAPMFIYHIVKFTKMHAYTVISAHLSRSPPLNYHFTFPNRRVYDMMACVVYHSHRNRLISEPWCCCARPAAARKKDNVTTVTFMGHAKGS